MEIEFLQIADAVDAVNGKLYMLGGCWNQHPSSSFPTIVRLGIALGLLISGAEARTTLRNMVTLSVVPSEGGGLVYAQEFEVMFAGRPLSKRINHRNIIAVNASLSIPGPGTYLVTATIDGLKKSVSFEAVPKIER
jgi:hypothetical protein